VDDSGVCFSPGALALLATIGGILQAAIIALFWALVRSKDDSIREARAERDRMADGWEATIGLGEQAVRRERRRS
jgi:biopolymer transport protein ExbB/TolQ